MFSLLFAEVNGTILNMSSPKKLLLKLTAKDDQILSSLVSRCGKWLVYADCRAVHLYSFAMVSFSLLKSILLVLMS